MASTDASQLGGKCAGASSFAAMDSGALRLLRVMVAMICLLGKTCADKTPDLPEVGPNESSPEVAPPPGPDLLICSLCHRRAAWLCRGCRRPICRTLIHRPWWVVHPGWGWSCMYTDSMLCFDCEDAPPSFWDAHFFEGLSKEIPSDWPPKDKGESSSLLLCIARRLGLAWLLKGLNHFDRGI